MICVGDIIKIVRCGVYNKEILSAIFSVVDINEHTTSSGVKWKLYILEDLHQRFYATERNIVFIGFRSISCDNINNCFAKLKGFILK